MICFECKESACGVCLNCGIALCENHGTLITGERSLPTENSLQRATIPTRMFLCEFDREHVQLAE